MATTIIGLTDTTKVLNSAVFTKNPIGLGVLVETYTLTPAGISSFNPSPLDPHPIFPTLVVETVNSSDISGGLKQVIVRYVGSILKESEQYIGKPSAEVPEQPTSLLDSELPPPTITLLPAGKKQLLPSQLYDGTISSNLFFSIISSGESKGTWVSFPYIANITYLEYASEENEATLFANYIADVTDMPLELRGIELPKPITGPFVDYFAGAGASVDYFGVKLSSISIRRTGVFNEITLAFKDFFRGYNI